MYVHSYVTRPLNLGESEEARKFHYSILPLLVKLASKTNYTECKRDDSNINKK